MTATNSEALRMLSRGDVRRALDEVDPLAVVEETLRAHHEGRTVLPPEAYLRWENEAGDYCRSLGMPGAIWQNGDLLAGMKVINASVGNPGRGMPRAGGFSSLFDPTTARPTLLADGAMVSSLRTAALTVSSIRTLWPRDTERVSFVGCGHIAQMHADLIARHIGSVTHLDVFDVDPAASARLADAWSSVEGRTATAHPDVESVLAGASVVITATTSNDPYIPRQWLADEVFIGHVSLDDIGPDVFEAASAIYVDDLELVVDNPRRILGQLLGEGRVSVTGSLGSVLCGETEIPPADAGLVVCNPFGMAILDVALLSRARDAAVDLDLGVMVDLTSEDPMSDQLFSVPAGEVRTA